MCWNSTADRNSIPRAMKIFFSALPPRPAVCLIEAREEKAEPFLIRTQDLRRRLQRLLGPPDPASKRLNLREFARGVRYRLTGSALEQTLTYYQHAKQLFPQRYPQMMRLRPPAVLNRGGLLGSAWLTSRCPAGPAGRRPADRQVRASVSATATSSAGLYVVRAGWRSASTAARTATAWGYDMARAGSSGPRSALPWPHYFSDLSGLSAAAPPYPAASWSSPPARASPRRPACAPPRAGGLHALRGPVAPPGFGPRNCRDAVDGGVGRRRTGSQPDDASERPFGRPTASSVAGPSCCPVAVWTKFNDDQAGNLAALIAYFAFVAIFPLLLVLATVPGYLAQERPATADELDQHRGVPVPGDRPRDPVESRDDPRHGPGSGHRHRPAAIRRPGRRRRHAERVV